MEKGAVVIPFSKPAGPRCSKRSMLKCQPKTHGAAMSSKPSPPLIALSEDQIPERLRRILRSLDGEQMQIVEVIAAAIARGAL